MPGVLQVMTAAVRVLYDEGEGGMGGVEKKKKGKKKKKRKQGQTGASGYVMLEAIHDRVWHHPEFLNVMYSTRGQESRDSDKGIRMHLSLHIHVHPFIISFIHPSIHPSIHNA